MVAVLQAPVGATRGARELAQLLGEDETRILVQDAQWQRFLKEGVTVGLTLRRYRGTSALTLSDLGIVAQDDEQRRIYDRTLKTGHRFILPKEVMDAAQTIESKARYRLSKYGFKTSWGVFVHMDKYEDWRSENEALRASYLRLRDRIYDEWDELVARSERDYVALAIQAWQSLVERRVDVPDLNEWIGTYVSAALAGLKSRQEVYDSFSYEWQTRYVPMAAAVAQDEAEADAIRLKAAQKAMLADIRRTAEADAANTCQRLAQDLIAEIRDEIYGVMVDSLECIEKDKNGRLPKGSSRGLKNLIEKCQTVVFWQDAALEQRIANLDRIMQTDSRKRSMEELKGVLTDLGAAARATLLDLDRTPTRKSNASEVRIRVENELGELAVGTRRSARGAVDLDLGEITQISPRSRRASREPLAI